MAEARLLVGLGAGNMALCNAYVSQSTSLKERTSAVANLAATGVRFIVCFICSLWCRVLASSSAP
jgi:hypothetical protein